MGTSYSMDGEIRIAPPLNFAEIQKAREVAMAQLRNGFDKGHAKPETVFEGYMALKPLIEEDEEVTDRGILTVTSSSALVPSHSPGSLSYSWTDLLKALMNALPHHSWVGEVTALHEDATSAYKLVVNGSEGTAKCVREVKGVSYIEWGDDSQPTPISELL